jgi:hypothetical protein
MPDDVVEFQSEDSHGAVLRLGYDPVDSDFGTLAVEIRADGLTCSEGVLSMRGDGLDTFLASLAADWRGWDGTRNWDALEHGMTIEATHRGNRVELLFIVRHDYKTDAWQVRLPVLVAPGESLSRLAKSSAELFKLRAHS